MTAFIIAKAIPWIIGLMGLLGVYLRGRHNGKVKATREVMEAYKKTRERIDNADLGIGATDDERRKRLREFSEQ